MKIYLKSILLSLIFLSCAQLPGPERYIASNGEATFGAELTFTSDELKEAGRQAGSHVVNSAKSMAAQKLLIEKITALCDGCYVDWMRDKYGLVFGRIIYPDGHYINITLDPWVVEVTASPIPSSELAKITERLNKDLYTAARDIGLRPGYTAGGGHIHFGLDGLFGGDPTLLRDFMVDLYNHDELGSGILADDQYNSPPMKKLPQDSQDAFKRIVSDFDRFPDTPIEAFATRIFNQVYAESISGWKPPQKYQGVNITRIVDGHAPEEQTIELRFIRPQQNADQFRLVATLFEKRVAFLKENRAKGIVPTLDSTPSYSGEQKFKKFITFVEESGLNPDDYLRLVGEEYSVLAWRYLEQKYPGQQRQKLAFLLQLASDSAYDMNGKGSFIINKLKEVTTVTPEHELILSTLVERYEANSQVMNQISDLLNSQLKWRGSEVAKLLKNSSGREVYNNCASLIRSLFVPLPQAI